MKKKNNVKKSALALAVCATVALSATACGAKTDATVQDTKTSQSETKEEAKEETKTTDKNSDGNKAETNASDTEKNTADKDAVSNGSESADSKEDGVNSKQSNKPVTLSATSTKPVVTTPATAPQNQNVQSVQATDTSKTEQENKKLTFVVRNHPASCTTNGWVEHICNEDPSKNYNDGYTAATGHDWDEGVVTKQPTYFETGIRTFKCKTCGEIRNDEIPMLDKTYHVKEVVPATCTSQGYTIYECDQVDGLTYKADYTAMIPHSWDDGKVTKPATIYETGVKTFTCSVCGETKTETIPMVEKTWHTGKTVAPTCTEKGYTVYICDQDENLTENRDFVDALGHDWNEGVVTKEPTCEHAGVRTYTCSRDGATKTEVIPALGHDWGEGVVTKPATCDEDGIRTYTCSRDGETKTEVIPALGHDWGEGVVTKPATCEEDGVRTFTCSHDASHQKTETIAALGHSYDNGVVTIEPTYENDGVRTFTCATCGKTYTEAIPAKKYTFTETVVAPTCTEKGYTLHTCNENAEKSYKDNWTEPTGHKWEEHTKDATCASSGSIDRVCTACGATEHVRDIPVNENHTWDGGTVIKAATCTEAGEMTYTCTTCGKTKTETVPATGHDFHGGNCNNCGVSEDYNDAHFRQTIFDQTNAFRAENGRGALTYLSQYQSVADLRAKEQAKAYGHTRPNGEPYYTAFEELGYGDRLAAGLGGENAGRMQGTFFFEDWAVNGWSVSPGHRQAMLADGADGIIVGTYYDPETQYYYAIQMFFSSELANQYKNSPSSQSADVMEAPLALDEDEETESNTTTPDTATAEDTSADTIDVTDVDEADATDESKSDEAIADTDTTGAETEVDDSDADESAVDVVDEGEVPDSSENGATEDSVDKDDDAHVSEDDIYFTDDTIGEEDEQGTVLLPADVVDDVYEVPAEPIVEETVDDDVQILDEADVVPDSVIIEDAGNSDVPETSDEAVEPIEATAEVGVSETVSE